MLLKADLHYLGIELLLVLLLLMCVVVTAAVATERNDQSRLDRKGTRVGTERGESSSLCCTVCAQKCTFRQSRNEWAYSRRTQSRWGQRPWWQRRILLLLCKSLSLMWGGSICDFLIFFLTPTLCCFVPRYPSGMGTPLSTEGRFLVWKGNRSRATSSTSSIPAGSLLHGVS